MSGPKTRRWFQLSLATCVVLMVVGSGLLWLNTKMRHREIRFPTKPFAPLGNEEDADLDIQCEEAELNELDNANPPVLFPAGRGWPFIYKLAPGPFSSMGGGWFLPEPPRVVYEAAVIDFAIALALLTATAFLSEYLIRRRGRSKQEVERE